MSKSITLSTIVFRRGKGEDPRSIPTLQSSGIVDATCLVTGFDDINATDFVPVAVSSVQLIEIGQDGAPAAVSQRTGDFRDGSTVAYTSISFEGAVAPRAFQVRALGRNAAGDPLVLQWAVTFSNNCGCGIWPVLEINDSIGWTVFTGLTEPLALLCPAVITPEPTSPPTAGPTSSPSVNPTSPPTACPSSSPSVHPTSPPTAGPTSSPSVNPTSPPTAGPTSEPTPNSSAAPSA